MKCECGFQFAGPGEYRNCEAFTDGMGDSGVICPECRTAYVCKSGEWVMVILEDPQTQEDGKLEDRVKRLEAKHWPESAAPYSRLPRPKDLGASR